MFFNSVASEKKLKTSKINREIRAYKINMSNFVPLLHSHKPTVPSGLTFLANRFQEETFKQFHCGKRRNSLVCSRHLLAKPSTGVCRCVRQYTAVSQGGPSRKGTGIFRGTRPQHRTCCFCGAAVCSCKDIFILLSFYLHFLPPILSRIPD